MSEPGRRLERVREDRWLGGVAGGLGRYVDVDPNLIRIAFLVAFLVGGSGFVVYLILWIVTPESRPTQEEPPRTRSASPRSRGDGTMTDRRLTKSRDERMIAGVCGGLAEYFGIDAVLVRVAFVLLGVFGGGGVIAYIVLMLIMPEPAVGGGSGGEASPPPGSPPGGGSEPPTS